MKSELPSVGLGAPALKALLPLLVTLVRTGAARAAHGDDAGDGRLVGGRTPTG